jgi:hypothetical protein
LLLGIASIRCAHQRRGLGGDGRGEELKHGRREVTLSQCQVA